MGRDLDDAGAGMLAAYAFAAPSQGKEYRMRGHRRMPDEGRLFAGIEKAQTYVVIGAVGREYERHFGVREFARHGQ